MIPALWPGDAIRVEPAKAEAPEPGEIVVFVRDGHLIAHRIVGSQRDADGVTLVTRGDAQRHADSPVRPSEIAGVATAVRRFGRERPIAPARPANGVILARTVRLWQRGRAALAGVLSRFTRARPGWLRPRATAGPSR